MSLNPRSLKNLQEVDPRMVRLWTRVRLHLDVTIIEGKRSKERQKELLARGATKTLDSKHCTEPLATATDAVPSDFNWNRADDWKELRKLYYLAGIVKVIAAEEGIDIRWGGDWDRDNDFTDQTFNDLVHWELV